jgi:hypothetical protein
MKRAETTVTISADGAVVGSTSTNEEVPKKTNTGDEFRWEVQKLVGASVTYTDKHLLDILRGKLELAKDAAEAHTVLNQTQAQVCERLGISVGSSWSFALERLEEMRRASNQHDADIATIGLETEKATLRRVLERLELLLSHASGDKWDGLNEAVENVKGFMKHGI